MNSLQPQPSVASGGCENVAGGGRGGTFPTWSLRQGDVLAVLRELPSESVHCCMTSPPYWGLRSYKTEPQVWGGDMAHEHEWKSQSRQGMTGGTNCQAVGGWAGGKVGQQTVFNQIEDATCPCGAWRGELGLEPTPELFVQHIVEVFREVKRVLRKDGTLFLNLGDSYAGSMKGSGGTGEWSTKQNSNRGSNFTKNRSPLQIETPGLKPKDLCGIPWHVAFALQADGWWLRSDIIWSKPNPMPESVTDRPTKAHEYLFLLAKSAHYYFDQEAVREPFHGERWGGETYEIDGNEQKQVKGLGRERSCRPNPTGRNLRTVWTIPTQPFPGAHFATYPEKLVEPCLRAGTSERGCCAKCGAPWERKVERENPSKEHNIGTDERYAGMKNMGGNHQTVAGLHRNSGGVYSSAKTVGWSPTCACATTTQPCTALDPFCGSGTTGVVALKLGRSFLGIDLNPAYVEMAQKRLSNVMPLFAHA